MKLVDLFEDDEKVKDAIERHILNVIDGDCSDMLEAYQRTGKVLYRGTKNGELFSKANIRQDRRPVEMNADSHELVNKAMAALKLPTRGNSLFVSADVQVARTWGSLNAIFVPDGWVGLVYDAVPKDGYSFTTISDKADALRYQDRLSKMSEEDKVEEMMKVIKKLNPRTFTSPQDLSEVLKKGIGDILIHAPAYYRLNLDNRYNRQNQHIAKELSIKLW